LIRLAMALSKTVSVFSAHVRVLTHGGSVAAVLIANARQNTSSVEGSG